MKFVKNIFGLLVLSLAAPPQVRSENKTFEQKVDGKFLGLNIRIFNRETKTYETVPGISENSTLKELKERIWLNPDEVIIIDTTPNDIVSQPRNIQTIEIY